MKKLIYEKGNETFVKDIKVFENPGSLKPAFNKTCLGILNLLSEKDMYPLEIAKELKIHEQKVYYYIKKLEAAGLIEISGKKEIKGALAKLYTTTAPAFGIELDGQGRKVLGLSIANVNENLKEFFRPFISENSFEGYIVVGSPDKHGPLMSWARDGHYSIYLGMLLGGLVGIGSKDFVKLDVEMRAENKMKENIITIGGPGVNLVTAEFNEYLPVRLLGEARGEAPKAIFGKELYSEKSKKKYKEETIGYVIKQENPFNKNKHIIVIAGIGRRGTKAAILAVTRHYDKILKGAPSDVARIVKGIDLTGDGSIDNIEVIE